MEEDGEDEEDVEVEALGEAGTLCSTGAVVVDGPEEDVFRFCGSRARFLVDSVGKLTGWLRGVCGVDTELHPIAGRTHEALFARALAEDRIIVTMDRKVVYTNNKRQVWAPLFFVATCDTDAYRDCIVSHFGVEFTADTLMMRCTACNRLGFEEINRTTAMALGVKPKVLDTTELFFQCLHCKKVFWEGPGFKLALNRAALPSRLSTVRTAGPAEEGATAGFS